MEMTETMDMGNHNIREELRRFYGEKKFAQIEEEIEQKAEERAKRIIEIVDHIVDRIVGNILKDIVGDLLEQTIWDWMQEQKHKFKQKSALKYHEAFKAGEEKNTISIATRMFNNGFTVKSIMTACDLSEQDVIAIRDHGCLPK